MGLFGEAKIKVLSIDDSKLIQLTNKNILESAGYKVLLAYSGEEGIKLAKSGSPDIILLDVTMPGMDGVATCQVLKRDAKTAPIPIIMCTSEQLGSDVEKAFASGAVGYVIKPVKTDRLLTKITEILSK
ncbi:MAG: response regulator [Elusimicrobiota bacterium]